MSGSFVVADSDRGLSAWDQSLAGASAKAGTKFLLYPLDTLKSRRQAQRLGQGLTVWTTRGIYRGLLPKLLLYTPYQAVYMGVYVRARDELLAAPWPLGGSPATFVLAGVTAEVTASLVRLPMEVSKLRLQLGVYSSSLDAARHFAKRPWDFYRHFVPQTLLHDCVFSACTWLIYESGRQWCFARHQSAELSMPETIGLGTVSGTVCALVTTPLDVIKTRIIGRASPEGTVGLRAMTAALRDEGLRTFWRGATLRVLHLAPSQGLYMLLYEHAKLRLATYRGSASS